MKQIENGNFPFYLPIFSGHDISSFGQGYFYPTVLAGIYIQISHIYYFLADLWFHWTLAALLMTLFCLRIRLSLAASLVGGVVYAYSPTILLRYQGHQIFLHQIAFYPVLLILAEEIINNLMFRKKLSLIAAGGVAGGILMLSQQPQILFYFLLILPVYILIRLIIRKDKIKLLRILFTIVPMVLLSFSLAAPTLFPMITSLKYSFRSMAGIESHSGWSLSFINMLSLLYPDIFIIKNTFWGEWSITESCCAAMPFALILSLYFIILNIFGKSGRTRLRLLLPLMLTALAFLLGPAEKVPWHNFFKNYLPLYASFRAHGRTSILIVISISILSAEGINTLIKYSLSKQYRRAPFLIFSIVNFFVFVFSIFLIIYISNQDNLINSLTRFGLLSKITDTLAFDDIGIIISALYRSILPTLFISFLFMLISAAALKSVQWGIILRLLLGIFLFLIMKDIKTNCNIAMSQMSPPVNKMIPGNIDKCLNDISARPFPHGKLCTITDNFFNLSLLYPGLEDVTGVDGNISGKYGLFLNRIYGFKPETNQIDTLTGYLNDSILQKLSIRWILADEHNSIKLKVIIAKLKVLEKSGDLTLYEYPEWTPEFSIDNPDAEYQILEKRDGYLKVSIHGKVEKGILYKNVSSPYWNVYINGKKMQWSEEDIWIKVNTSEEGVLEYKFFNKPAVAGIYVFLAGVIILPIIFIFFRNKKNQNPDNC